MNVSIIGTGYVGLVTGACFADVGNHVLCVDHDAEKVGQLQRGKIPIYEPGLERLVQSNVKQGRLRFTTDIKETGIHTNIIFIAVGTPPNEDGSADLVHVLNVAKSIGMQITDYTVVVTKSTVPVGTSEKVRKTIQQELDNRGISTEFSVVSNPEFLKEGAAIDDFMKPDRVVIGADNEKAIALIRSLYAPFNRNHERILVMDIASAELTKYAANAMLATKISFMNELSNIADLLGADIELVRQGIGSDPRIGYHFIYPGCGYGGSCFPKDVKALQKTAKDKGYPTPVLDAVEDVNKKQKMVLVNKVKNIFGNSLSGKKIAIWGLAFKPNTDDMREASSLVVIKELLQAGATIKAYDPIAIEEAKKHFQNDETISFCQDMYEATEQADALLIITEWKAFRSPNFDRLKAKLSQPIIIDGRNIYDAHYVINQGFQYYAIGRNSILKQSFKIIS